MSSEEAAGTSSSYYSTASSNSTCSSSAENISSGASSVDTGDLAVFTFMMSRSASMDLLSASNLTESVSGTHLPNCICTCNRTNRFKHSEMANNSHFDPFGVAPNRYLCHANDKYDKICRSSLFGDNFSRLLSQSTLDGLLLRSMEKGVLYPVIHWTPKCNENLTHHNHIGSSAIINQGVYKELKRVVPADAWIHKSEDCLEKYPPKRPTWLVIGYKSLEKTLDSTLEATWKEWTGCRNIYLNLRNDFEIRRISFFHRVYPEDNLDLFMYIVLMEIGNVDERNLMWLLDFVQRTRVERMKGFLTVYGEVDNEFSTMNDEYMRLFSNELSKSKSSQRALETVASQEINGNLKFIEKLIEELHQAPMADYF